MKSSAFDYSFKPNILATNYLEITSVREVA